jgi:hypothetical protein
MQLYYYAAVILGMIIPLQANASSSVNFAL